MFKRTPGELAYDPDQVSTVSGSRIIIVTGPPASGKTTLAARLAKDPFLPAITKDGIKEALLDSASIEN